MIRFSHFQHSKIKHHVTNSHKLKIKTRNHKLLQQAEKLEEETLSKICKLSRILLMLAAFTPHKLQLPPNLEVKV